MFHFITLVFKFTSFTPCVQNVSFSTAIRLLKTRIDMCFHQIFVIAMYFFPRLLLSTFSLVRFTHFQFTWFDPKYIVIQRLVYSIFKQNEWLDSWAVFWFVVFFSPSCNFANFIFCCVQPATLNPEVSVTVVDVSSGNQTQEPVPPPPQLNEK